MPSSAATPNRIRVCGAVLNTAPGASFALIMSAYSGAGASFNRSRGVGARG